MANLWRQDEQGWETLALGTRDAFELGRGRQAGRAGPALVRYADSASGRERWALIAGVRARARVNGQLVIGGVRAIRDRDLIEVGEESWFFSAERLPVVESYPAGVPAVTCRRCGLPMLEGQVAVRCPSCESWHHELPERRCWSVLARTNCCSRPTAGDAYLWTPEFL